MKAEMRGVEERGWWSVGEAHMQRTTNQLCATITQKVCFTTNDCHLKDQFTPKSKLCHHLLTLMSFQTCMTVNGTQIKIFWDCIFRIQFKFRINQNWFCQYMLLILLCTISIFYSTNQNISVHNLLSKCNNGVTSKVIWYWSETASFSRH